MARPYLNDASSVYLSLTTADIISLCRPDRPRLLILFCGNFSDLLGRWIHELLRAGGRKPARDRFAADATLGAARRGQRNMINRQGGKQQCETQAHAHTRARTPWQQETGLVLAGVVGMTGRADVVGIVGIAGIAGVVGWNWGEEWREAVWRACVAAVACLTPA